MYSPLAGVEFNRLVSSGLQILDSRGCLCPPEEELPSFLGFSKPNFACMSCPRCVSASSAQENQRQGSFFFFLNPTTAACSGYERILLLACLLTLRFIFRACWIQATYFLTHTHIHTLDSMCVDHTDTPGMHVHTHTMGSRGRTLVWPESFFCLKSGISAITDGEGRGCHPQTLHLFCFGSLAQRFDLFSCAEPSVVWRLAYLSASVSARVQNQLFILQMSSCVFAWDQINNIEGS